MLRRPLPLFVVGTACVTLSACLVFPTASERGTFASRREAEEIASIARSLDSIDSVECMAAARELGRFGSGAAPAVPALARALRDGDPAIRAAAAAALSEIGPSSRLVRARIRQAAEEIAGTLLDDDPRVRHLACDTLGSLGRLAREQAPALNERLDKEKIGSVRLALRTARVRITGSEETHRAPFVDGLWDDSPEIRRLAVLGLHAITRTGVDELGPEVLAELERMLRGESWRIRRAAASTLAGLGPIGLEILRGGLSHRDPSVREDSARGIAETGAAGVIATPDLLGLLEDPRVRSEAARALGRIGRGRPDALRGLIDLLENSRGELPACREALGRIGRGAVRSLAELLGSSDRRVAAAAAEILIEIKPSVGSLPATASPTAVERIARAQVGGALSWNPQSRIREISEFLDSESAVVRREALRALAYFRTPAHGTVARLVSLLDDPDADVRAAAWETLGRFGPAASESVPQLLRRLNGPPEARRKALFALGQIGPAAVPAVRTLLRILRLRGEEGTHAVWTLGKIGPTASEAAPLLIARLQGGDLRSRKTVVMALGEIAPGGPEVVGALLDRFPSAEPPLQVEILRSLERIGREWERVVPLLRSALEAPELVRRQAARTLVAFASKEGRPDWLDPLLDHDDPRIAAWAREGLGAIGW